MLKTCGSFILFLAMVCSDKVSYKGYKVYKVICDTDLQARLVWEKRNDPGIDIWAATKPNHSELDVMVAPEVQPSFEEFLRMIQVRYVIMIEDVGQLIERQMGAQLRGSYIRYGGGGIDFNRYLRYDEIYNYLTSLAENYPDLVETENIGYSFEGRATLMIKISSDRSAEKPVYFMEAGMHAREWAGPATVLYLINQLVENYTNTQQALKNIDYYIIPVANPDGYEYSHTTDRMWRKTRSMYLEDGCEGADGNRNFGFHWAEMGTSRNPCSDTYQGLMPFSEKETQNLRDAAVKYRFRIAAYTAVHSYGSYILYPWGYAKELPSDWTYLHRCAKAAAEAIHDVYGTEYTVGSSAMALYEAAGGSDDWFKGMLNVPYAYTIELPATETEGFQLPAHKIEAVGRETFEAFKTIARCAVIYFRPRNKMRSRFRNITEQSKMLKHRQQK